MSRIIRAQNDQGSHESLPPIGLLKFQDRGRVIEGETYKAQLLARDILSEGDQARSRKLAEARSAALLMREEASANAALEAFDCAGQKAIEIFTQRARYLSNAQTDIKTLALEIVEKILGGPMHLGQARQDEILANGMRQLRAKRKLVVQCPIGMLSEFDKSYHDLSEQISKEPDISIDEASDIKPGNLRIVTDAGSALCQESVIMSVLQQILYDQ